MLGSPINFPASWNPKQMASAHAEIVECTSSMSEAFGKFDHSCWHVMWAVGLACGVDRSLGAALPASCPLPNLEPLWEMELFHLLCCRLDYDVKCILIQRLLPISFRCYQHFSNNSISSFFSPCLAEDWAWGWKLETHSSGGRESVVHYL